MQESKKKILLVEDEPHLAFNMEFNLKEEGYDVITAITGREALDNYHKHKPFDLILLDVMLPELSGFEVARSIRETDKTTGVLMLTARAAEEDVIKGLECGAGLQNCPFPARHQISLLAYDSWSPTHKSHQRWYRG